MDVSHDRQVGEIPEFDQVVDPAIVAFDGRLPQVVPEIAEIADRGIVRATGFDMRRAELPDAGGRRRIRVEDLVDELSGAAITGLDGRLCAEAITHRQAGFQARIGLDDAAAIKKRIGDGVRTRRPVVLVGEDRFRSQKLIKGQTQAAGNEESRADLPVGIEEGRRFQGALFFQRFRSDFRLLPEGTPHARLTPVVDCGQARSDLQGVSGRNRQ
jgi:hypothetical protein